MTNSVVTISGSHMASMVGCSDSISNRKAVPRVQTVTTANSSDCGVRWRRKTSTATNGMSERDQRRIERRFAGAVVQKAVEAAEKDHQAGCGHQRHQQQQAAVVVGEALLPIGLLVSRIDEPRRPTRDRHRLQVRQGGVEGGR